MIVGSETREESEPNSTSVSTLRITIYKLALLLTCNLMVALIVSVATSDTDVRTFPRGIGRNFLVSLVYANCLGPLLFVTLSGFGFRFIRRSSKISWFVLPLMILGVSTAGCLLAGIILVALNLIPITAYWFYFNSSLVLAIVLSFICGSAMLLGVIVQAKFERTRAELKKTSFEMERARKLVAEARLSSLESRIHPHFLFNTLNSISSLIQESPQQAELMVGRLASLLRFSLDSSHRNTVTLSQEMKTVIDFLEIEKARFGDRLSYSVSIPHELELIEVPTLALQTLVENSVKYVVSQRGGGEIGVAVRAVDGRAYLQVSDTGPGFTQDKITAGHGLHNLQERLGALYQSAGTLEVQSYNRKTVVTVSLPIQESSR